MPTITISIENNVHDCHTKHILLTVKSHNLVYCIGVNPLLSDAFVWQKLALGEDIYCELSDTQHFVFEKGILTFTFDSSNPSSTIVFNNANYVRRIGMDMIYLYSNWSTC